MADEQHDRTSSEEGDSQIPPQNGGGSSLADFITEQYEQQKEAGMMTGDDGLSDERTANFFNRALSESSRMNKEIAKCKKKLDKLEDEFGSEMINAWRAEHASEVLSKEKAAAVERAQNGAFC